MSLQPNCVHKRWIPVILSLTLSSCHHPINNKASLLKQVREHLTQTNIGSIVWTALLCHFYGFYICFCERLKKGIRREGPLSKLNNFHMLRRLLCPDIASIASQCLFLWLTKVSIRTSRSSLHFPWLSADVDKYLYIRWWSVECISIYLHY